MINDCITGLDVCHEKKSHDGHDHFGRPNRKLNVDRDACGDMPRVQHETGHESCLSHNSEQQSTHAIPTIIVSETEPAQAQDGAEDLRKVLGLNDATQTDFENFRNIHINLATINSSDTTIACPRPVKPMTTENCSTMIDEWDSSIAAQPRLKPMPQGDLGSTANEAESSTASSPPSSWEVPEAMLRINYFTTERPFSAPNLRCDPPPPFNNDMVPAVRPSDDRGISERDASSHVEEDSFEMESSSSFAEEEDPCEGREELSRGGEMEDPFIGVLLHVEEEVTDDITSSFHEDGTGYSVFGRLLLCNEEVADWTSFPPEEDEISNLLTTGEAAPQNQPAVQPPMQDGWENSPTG
ncbi:hypothetical protein QQS21_009746 [Conoideocrella luteorostrata]|uniref:Uncharacterized protein n=1 Tax=Conoideocrella luteorostrata TaxID=1105319 RepID=A0AAJ0CKT5_9HYPO|nr:hypothetical protein QQS21_009746 [Conoideocrella luteorostrata]